MLTGPDDPNVLDRAMVGAAVLTAVHCLAASWLARIHPLLAGDAAHLVLAGGLVVGSIWATGRGFGRHHEIRPMLWNTPGWLLLGVARLASAESLGPSGEALGTALAGVLLTVGHQLNRSLAYWSTRTDPERR